MYQILSKNPRCIAIFHPFLFDLAFCCYFLFPKLKISLKKTHYKNILVIEVIMTAVQNDVSQQKLRELFEVHIILYDL